MEWTLLSEFGEERAAVGARVGDGQSIGDLANAMARGTTLTQWNVWWERHLEKGSRREDGVWWMWWVEWNDR